MYVVGNGQNMSMASMWTRKDIKEFKDAIRKEGGDAIIKVGHGETVTVSMVLIFILLTKLLSSRDHPIKYNESYFFPIFLWPSTVYLEFNILIPCVYS